MQLVSASEMPSMTSGSLSAGGRRRGFSCRSNVSRAFALHPITREHMERIRAGSPGAINVESLLTSAVGQHEVDAVVRFVSNTLDFNQGVFSFGKNRHNAGTGSILYSIGKIDFGAGLAHRDGSLQNGPLWGTRGITHAAGNWVRFNTLTRARRDMFALAGGTGSFSFGTNRNAPRVLIRRNQNYGVLSPSAIGDYYQIPGGYSKIAGMFGTPAGWYYYADGRTGFRTPAAVPPDNNFIAMSGLGALTAECMHYNRIAADNNSNGGSMSGITSFSVFYTGQSQFHVFTELAARIQTGGIS